MSLSILMVAREAAPYSSGEKAAEAVTELCRALRRTRTSVRVVLPHPPGQELDGRFLARRIEPLLVPFDGRTEKVALFEGTLPGGRVPVFVLDHPIFLGDDADGRASAFLARAALQAAHERNLWPQVVHGHDEAGALACALAKAGAIGGRPVPATLVTIHDISTARRFPPSLRDTVGLPAGDDTVDGELSLLRAGIVCADVITTVSRRHARDLKEGVLGGGLADVLQARADRFFGILDGLDTDAWNPERDGALEIPYTAIDRSGKEAARSQVRHEVALPARPRTPLVAFLSDLTAASGLDLVARAAAELARLDAQYLFAGHGRSPSLESLAGLHPAKIAVRKNPDERLQRRILAGADFLLLPSKNEPCGVWQMRALRYGTPPIVHAAGGLDETVVDFDEASRSGNGFKFYSYDAQALVAAVKRAITVYKQKDLMDALIREAMSVDFSWDTSAARYVELYERLAEAARPAAA